MGCCFSSTTVSKTDQKNQNLPKPHHSPLKPQILQSHKTPPPPSPPPPPEEDEEDEEETIIKEVLVLSETPTLRKKQDENITQTLPPKTQTEVTSPVNPIKKQQQEPEGSDLSQLSEIYSVSETISTATTTTTATKGVIEDEATSKANSQVKHKSPAKVVKKRPSNGDKGIGNGSVRARRVDPSPEKRARGRGRGLGEVRTVHRTVGSRSRSPGTGRAGGVGRGIVGNSPATAVTEKADSKSIGRATEEGQSKREQERNNTELEQQQQAQQGTESLENPLVSLECFIFL